MSEPLDRERLVTAMIAGDEAAWRTYVAEYGGLIRAVAAYFGLHGDDRDDLFQITCLAALKSIGSLRKPSRLASWTYNVAWRAAIDWKRRRKREERTLDPSRPLRPEPAAKASIGEDELIRLEEELHLYQALEAIDVRCRRMLTALYLENPRVSYAELAERLGMPVGSIGPVRARCLQQVQRLFLGLSNGGPERLPEGRRNVHGQGRSKRSQR